MAFPFFESVADGVPERGEGAGKRLPPDSPMEERTGSAKKLLYFGMKNAYDFKRVERRNFPPVRFFGPIEKKYLGFLGLLIFGVLLFTIFGSRGLMQIYQLREERDRIQVNNARLEDENKKLAEQIRRLRTDKQGIERIAREEMMLVRKGEIVYQFEK